MAGLVRTLKDTEDKKESLEAQADTAKKQLVRILFVISYLLCKIYVHHIRYIFIISDFIVIK